MNSPSEVGQTDRGHTQYEQLKQIETYDFLDMAEGDRGSCTSSILLLPWKERTLHSFVHGIALFSIAIKWKVRHDSE